MKETAHVKSRGQVLREYQDASVLRFKPAPNRATITVKLGDIDNIYLDGGGAIWVRYSIDTVLCTVQIFSIGDVTGDTPDEWLRLTRAFCELQHAICHQYWGRLKEASGGDTAELETIEPVVIDLTQFDTNGRKKLDIY